MAISTSAHMLNLSMSLRKILTAGVTLTARADYVRRSSIADNSDLLSKDPKGFSPTL